MGYNWDLDCGVSGGIFMGKNGKRRRRPTFNEKREAEMEVMTWLALCGLVAAGVIFVVYEVMQLI